MSHWDHLSYDEYIELFQKIKKRLCMPFDRDIIQINSNNKPFIPSPAYKERLNKEAPGLWSFRKTNQFIHEKEGIVQVDGIIRLFHAEYEGVGFHRLTKKEGRIVNLEYAIRSAVSDCIRDCCDKIGMGRKDLEDYGNESNATMSRSKDIDLKDQTDQRRRCKVCKAFLTEEDENFLENHEIKIPYCKNDIPNSLMRRYL